jgi:hypothetical protein
VSSRYLGGRELDARGGAARTCAGAHGGAYTGQRAARATTRASVTELSFTIVAATKDAATFRKEQGVTLAARCVDDAIDIDTPRPVRQRAFVGAAAQRSVRAAPARPRLTVRRYQHSVRCSARDADKLRCALTFRNFGSKVLSPY